MTDSDGAETPADEQDDADAEVDDERPVMAEVRHDPPNDGTDRTYERGTEGREGPVTSGRSGQDDE